MSGTGKHPHSQRSHRQQPENLATTAAMETFVQLQQHQADYLQWLEACDRKSDIDRYAYKKIR